jgi:hypothetical protein
MKISERTVKRLGEVITGGKGYRPIGQGPDRMTFFIVGVPLNLRMPSSAKHRSSRKTGPQQTVIHMAPSMMEVSRGIGVFFSASLYGSFTLLHNFEWSTGNGPFVRCRANPNPCTGMTEFP